MQHICDEELIKFPTGFRWCSELLSARLYHCMADLPLHPNRACTIRVRNHYCCSRPGLMGGPALPMLE